MLSADDGQFASTFVGAYLIPVLVGFPIAAICAVVTIGFKLSKRLDRQDAWMGAQGEKTERLAEAVRDIKAEVHPNGGSSLKDAVNRIEAEQKSVAKKLKKHLADTAAA